MYPRLILIAVTAFLLVFGLLMIYSASSVNALSSTGSASYYLVRQFFFVILGVIIAFIIAYPDYHLWCDQLLPLLWVGVLVLLLLTLMFGSEINGAKRWIVIAGIQVQPSEIAKVLIILTASNIGHRFFETSEIDASSAILQFLVGVGLPLILILVEPDKGATGIIVCTLFIMLYIAGIPLAPLFIIVLVAAIAFIVLVLSDEYSLSRVEILFDPWSDPYGAAWQLVQALYAFGRGGLRGVGVGMSRQKYSYIPEAHNDFIFAIIGEEWGLFGTLIVVGCFAAIVYAGIQIMRYAPDLSGRLIAVGCTSIIVIQFFVNVGGVIGIIPLTGKPLPFLSYGGSSAISCLMMVGLLCGVSRASSLPETEHDRRRRHMSVVSSNSQNVGRYHGRIS